MSKQTARLDDWIVVEGNYLRGIVYGHSSLYDGMFVRTSTIVSIDYSNMICETQNTIYTLGNQRKADPTPPAQSNVWKEAVLLQCMAIEGCYNENNPIATMNCLIDWYVRNTANWTKGATPPAPKVEPVADLAVSDINGRKDSHFDYYGTLENGQYLLYTHPANDGLRKAAAEALADIEAVYDASSGWLHDSLYKAMTNLRAELNKGKA